MACLVLAHTVKRILLLFPVSWRTAENFRACWPEIFRRFRATWSKFSGIRVFWKLNFHVTWIFAEQFRVRVDWHTVRSRKYSGFGLLGHFISGSLIISQKDSSILTRNISGFGQFVVASHGPVGVAAGSSLSVFGTYTQETHIQRSSSYGSQKSGASLIDIRVGKWTDTVHTWLSLWNLHKVALLVSNLSGCNAHLCAFASFRRFP